MTLGRRCGCARALQQKELALDPEQLGNEPMFFALLGSRDCLIHRGKPFGDLPGPSHPEAAAQNDELGCL
jgi:hypothetical protein